MFLVALWQSSDSPFNLEGKASTPESPLEHKSQTPSATQIPSAPAATRLMFGESTSNVSRNPCVQAAVSGSYQVEIPLQHLGI